MLIRPSQVADIGTITRIYAQYVLTSPATFETEPPDETEIGARRDAILGHPLPFLVAESDGAVIGYAYATLYRPRAAYRLTVEDSIYMDPGQVGKGAGRLLLGAVIGECDPPGTGRCWR